MAGGAGADASFFATDLESFTFNVDLISAVSTSLVVGDDMLITLFYWLSKKRTYKSVWCLLFIKWIILYQFYILFIQP